MRKVSIIIPTYNRADMLEKAVQSAINQNYEQKEILIIDDGSTDKTYKKIKYLIDDEIVKYFYQATNRGISSIMNIGISMSKGDLITVLHDDDLFYDSLSLSCRVNFFDLCINLEVLWTSAYDIDDKEKLLKIFRGEPANVLRILKEDYIYMSTMMWKKDIWTKIGLFDEELLSNEDWDFKIKCHLECQCLGADIITLKYRRHQGNKSTINKNKMKQYELIFRRKLKERYKDLWEMNY